MAQEDVAPSLRCSSGVVQEDVAPFLRCNGGVAQEDVTPTPRCKQSDHRFSVCTCLASVYHKHDSLGCL